MEVQDIIVKVSENFDKVSSSVTVAGDKLKVYFTGLAVMEGAQLGVLILILITLVVMNHRKK